MTYEEKWNAMSVEEQADMTKKLQGFCEQLIGLKEDFRLNGEFKEWVASSIIQVITKNHFIIHHFHGFCESKELSLFDSLEACIKNYEDAIAKAQARQKELDTAIDSGKEERIAE